MKELCTANPFHLMNRPFAEMDYNSSGLNIVPERLLLATRRPSTHYSLASGAAFFDPLRATCRCAINHLNTRHNIWRPPASHLPASSPRDTRQPIANHPPSRCAPSADHRASFADTLQAICWHGPMPLTACRTNRRREQEPQISAKTRSA